MSHKIFVPAGRVALEVMGDGMRSTCPWGILLEDEAWATLVGLCPGVQGLWNLSAVDAASVCGNQGLWLWDLSPKDIGACWVP